MVVEGGRTGKYVDGVEDVAVGGAHLSVHK